MKRALMRNFSLNRPNSITPQTLKANPNLLSFSPPPPPSSLASICSQLRFFSSSITDSAHTQNQDASVDVKDVSNQELKMLIDKYGEGDGEAIPLIFEAILKRKLARKHEESDDEFMDELRKKPVDSSVRNEENESDSDEFDETDEESEDESDD